MNCINHPNAEVAAYCQQCGKPLCKDCVRSVGGMIYCEPCLAARLGMPGSGYIPGAMPGAMPGAILPPSRPNPMLAGLLGLIPGVGAMYNGQFVKALAHVLIFAIFASLSDRSSIFGILVAAWVVYQAFDAYHTAKARLQGLPLPNPFGLNDLGARLGIPQTPFPHTPAAGFYPPGQAPGPTSGQNAGSSPGQPAGSPIDPSSASAHSSWQVPIGESGPVAGFGPTVSQQPGMPPVPPVPPPPPPYYWQGEPVPPPVPNPRAPFGAIVLIVIGLALLLQTLGIFRDEWLDRTWPLLIVVLGGWLLYRRTHETGGGGPQ